MKNCVYRFINSGEEIIYVGKAKDLKNRLMNHTHLSNKGVYGLIEKIEYISFNTEDDMDFAEVYYISKYKPRFNTADVEKEITINAEFIDNHEWKELSSNDEVEDINKMINTYEANYIWYFNLSELFMGKLIEEIENFKKTDKGKEVYKAGFVYNGPTFYDGVEDNKDNCDLIDFRNQYKTVNVKEKESYDPKTREFINVVSMDILSCGYFEISHKYREYVHELKEKRFRAYAKGIE